jgi:hypothetical protein
LGVSSAVDFAGLFGVWCLIVLCVIICVMICVASGVFAVGLRFPAVPGWVVRVACKGVWWMPWQTVPMKDV